MKGNGKRSQLKEGKLKIYRGSDQFIVLGEQESCSQGEGIDPENRDKGNIIRTVGSEEIVQTSLREIANIS